MNIRDYLAEIGSHYDRGSGLQTETQRLLREAPTQLAQLVPAGYVVIGSGGKGTATFTPWFGFFDPDETISPERGLYLCYLFRRDLTTVTLTLMQGITELDRTLGRRQARERLAEEAAAIRSELPGDEVGSLSDGLELGSKGYRQLAYESGCVVSRSYPVQDLPSETSLREDLNRLLLLYQQAVGIKRDLLQSAPGVIASPSVQQHLPGDDPLLYFKPKDESDYVTVLAGRVLVKTRRHERLVRQYGTWLASNGFAVSTRTHPRDLVASRDENEWLIEAKVLYLGNATEAVRAALGQLYSYRHFLYPSGASPTMVGLFSEPIGAAFVSFLETAEVASVWYETGRWVGSDAAVANRLAVRP
jgi:MrcB-like, N-terminal domain